MGVGTRKLNMRNLINRVKARKTARRYRAPNCTHLDMDRVFGQHQQCDICGRPPSIGFLYECRQDWETQSLHDVLMEDLGDDGEEVVKSSVRLQMEALEFSESIIRAAENGQYTDAQLEKIKAQKTELRQIISDSLQASQINSAAAKLAAMASNNDGACDSTLEKEAGPPPCAVKACHSCRPYYRDRIWISFQAVLDADFSPMTREDIDVLPTKSARTMKTIGASWNARPTPLSLPTFTSLATSTDAPPTASTTTSTSSDLTFKTTQTDVDAIHSQGHPRRGFYKQGHRSSGDIIRALSRRRSNLIRPGLRSALQGIFRPSRASSSAGSNITLPTPRTRTARNSSEVEDVEDRQVLRKARRQDERGGEKHGDVLLDGANHGSTADDSGVECQDDDMQDMSSSSFDSSVCSDASDGGEIEEHGGVALQAHENITHTPVARGVGVSSLKNGVVVQDVEMDGDADDEADIGFQSIMTQV